MRLTSLISACALGVLMLASCSAQAQKKDLSGYSFRDTRDSVLTLADCKGQYVLIEVWAMSCRPCLLQMPFFTQLAGRYSGKGIRFLSVCVENNVPLWKNFLTQRKIEGEQLITPIGSPFLEDNGFIAVPRFVLLDKKGRLLSPNTPLPSDPALQAQLDKLLEN